MPQTLITEQCIFPGKVRACSPCCLPLWGPGAPGKQSVELVSAEGGRQPVLPSPRTGKVAAKPPDEVLPAAFVRCLLKEEHLLTSQVVCFHTVERTPIAAASISTLNSQLYLPASFPIHSMDSLIPSSICFGLYPYISTTIGQSSAMDRISAILIFPFPTGAG